MHRTLLLGKSVQFNFSSILLFLVTYTLPFSQRGKACQNGSRYITFSKILNLVSFVRKNNLHTEMEMSDNTYSRRIAGCQVQLREYLRSSGCTQKNLGWSLARGGGERPSWSNISLPLTFVRWKNGELITGLELRSQPMQPSISLPLDVTEAWGGGGESGLKSLARLPNYYLKGAFPLNSILKWTQPVLLLDGAFPYQPTGQW